MTYNLSILHNNTKGRYDNLDNFTVVLHCLGILTNADVDYTKDSFNKEWHNKIEEAKDNLKKWEESLQKVKRVNRPQLFDSQSPSHAAAAVKEQAAPASGAERNLEGRIVVAQYNHKGSGHGDITFKNKEDKLDLEAQDEKQNKMLPCSHYSSQHPIAHSIKGICYHQFIKEGAKRLEMLQPEIYKRRSQNV